MNLPVSVLKSENMPAHALNTLTSPALILGTFWESVRGSAGNPASDGAIPSQVRAKLTMIRKARSVISTRKLEMSRMKVRRAAMNRPVS